MTATDDSLVELTLAATRFRKAIERCDPKYLTVCMQNFPTGSCGDATPLLGTYLTEEGIADFNYMLGERTDDGVNGRHTHAWLENDGLIVDITADQFAEVDQKVIVTRHSDWHDSFERQELEHAADFRVYDQRTVASLRRTYAAILDELERL